MLQQKRPDDFLIPTGESHSLEEFAATTFESPGLNWRDHVVVDPSLFRLADIMVGKANPSKAREILGWRARYKMRDVAKITVEERVKNDNSLGDSK